MHAHKHSSKCETPNVLAETFDRGLCGQKGMSQAAHREGSLLGGVQQGLQALAVQAVGFPEVVDVQPVRHSCPAIRNAEEVPLGVTIGAAVW